jgi:hypothetical protein
LHQRIATIAEIRRGHKTVLREFRARPGRWHLWIEVDDVRCPDCGDYSGRYLQFALLEDGVTVIGECASSNFLDEALKFTDDQEAALRTLGWKDAEPASTPNWHFEAATDGGVATLGDLTERTLRDVFGLVDRDRAVIRFQQRIVEGGSA